jgi:hypothetical protein
VANVRFATTGPLNRPHWYCRVTECSLLGSYGIRDANCAGASFDHEGKQPPKRQAALVLIRRAYVFLIADPCAATTCQAPLGIFTQVSVSRVWVSNAFPLLVYFWRKA